MLGLFGFMCFASVGQLVYTQQECMCANNISVVPVDLYEFAVAEPLYSQVASTATEQLSIDNVCYTSDFYEYGVVEMAMAIRFRNNSTSTTFLQQVELEPGVFLISGDADFVDVIIGVPCRNVFVIYRCFYKRLPCPTNVNEVIVIIESSDEYAPRQCIRHGISIAQKQFPNIQFYTLPMNLDTNCYDYCDDQ